MGFIARFVAISAISVVGVLAAGCSAPSSGEDDAEDSQDAITGSPTEERAKAAEALNKAYQDKILTAYAKANLAAFTTKDRGQGLVGEAASDYATVNKACAAKGYKISAQVWAVTTQASQSDTKVVPRKLFTVDVYGKDYFGQDSTTTLLGIYDERGALIVGEAYSATNIRLLKKTPEDFRALMPKCKGPE